MVRYFKVKNGIECQTKYKGKMLIVRRCRRIKTKESVPTRRILKEIGIRSY